VAAKKRIASPKASSAQTGPAVAAFLRELEHPLKKEIAAVRQMILGASPKIREGIKWNAPSFCTSEYFATVNLRSREMVQLIFHRGAKARNDLPQGMKLADPAGLIKWLGKDRCLVTLGAGKDLAVNRAAFEKIVREWIQYV